jgi:hypothetical protein
MKRQPDKPVITLPNEPYIHPSIANAGPMDPAKAYMLGREIRKAQARVPKTNVPVTGSPPISIPRLDQGPVREGLTMEQNAVLSRQMQQPQQQPQQQNSIVEPVVRTQPMQLQLAPTDILPNEAREDPAFISGYGDMFAANQPGLAAKYGVVRAGKRIVPQQLTPQAAAGDPSSRKLRPETLRDLQTLQELQKTQMAQAPNTLPDDASAEKAASEGAQASGNVGIPSAGSSKSDTAATKELSDTLSGLDEFEFDAWRRAMMKDIINNPDQREIVESRLEPLDIGELITRGYITQKVLIIPTKFEPVYITTDGETDLALKRLIMTDAKSLEMSDRYFLDKFGLMSMAAHLYAINNKPFLDHRDKDGNFNDEAFMKKFSQVLKLPLPMLASLGVNALWFDIRVRKLFVVEKLSNG